MLHKISWPQFLLIIALGLFIYYAFILLRYYAKELRAFAQGNRPGSSGANGGQSTSVVLPDSRAGAYTVEGRLSDKVPESGDPSKGQVTLFPESPASESDKPELFKVMEKVIATLRVIVDDGVSTGIGREELEERIHGVLINHRYLRKTPFEFAINNFIVRTCTTHFSLMLSDEELARLW